MNCKFQQPGWVKYQCHVHSLCQNARIKLQVLFRKLKPKPSFSLFPESLALRLLSDGRLLSLNKEYYKQSFTWKYWKGYRRPILFLLLKAGRCLKTTALNSRVPAWIYHGMHIKRKVHLFTRLEERGSHAESMKLPCISHVFKGNLIRISLGSKWISH